MSLRNRLRKMETRITGSDSEFCDCKKEPQIIVLTPTADGKGETVNGEPYKEPPEFCQTCSKPNPERAYITFTINPST